MAAPRAAAPARLQISVGFGNERCPTSLRDDVEREVLALLDEARCFSAVVREDSTTPAELRLHVELDDFEESVDYDLTLADRADPRRGPDAAQAYTARVEARVFLRLSAAGQAEPLGERSLHLSQSRRPLASENAAHLARESFVGDVARAARSFACRSKWRERAGAETGD